MKLLYKWQRRKFITKCSHCNVIFLLIILIWLNFTNAENPPIIKEHPKSMTTRKNDPVTLNCGASEGSRIRWYKDGTPIPDKSRNHRYMVLDSGSLFFLRVIVSKKDNDSGVYWCQARNNHGFTRSRNATLTVSTLDTEFLEEPNPIIDVVSGDSLRMPCRPPVGVPAPSVQWKRNELVLKNSSRVFVNPEGDLVFKKVVTEDRGVYVCVARNLAAERQSNPTTLNVLFPPRLEEKPTNVTANVGTSVELFCKAQGNPAPGISWRRLDGQIPISRTHITQNNGLQIQNIVQQDSGTYLCDAKNSVGSVSASAILKVVSIPSFKEKPMDNLLLSGVNLVLKCLVEGDPPPITIWKLPVHGHTSHLISGQADGRFSCNENASQLRITNLQINDTGPYQCWGTSPGGGVTAVSHVVVVKSFPPPLIGVKPLNQSASLGSTATLSCEPASDMSEPTLTWWTQQSPDSPEKRIMSKGRVSILSTGTLIIKGLSYKDEGYYKCKVSSNTGSAIAEVFLEVSQKSGATPSESIVVPAPPSKPKIVAYNTSSIHLSWLPNSHKQSVPLSVKYVVQYWRSPWKEWQTALTGIMKENCIVSGLLSTTAYIFTVRAVSKAGESFPSPWSDFVYTVEADEPSLSPVDEIQTRRKLNKQILTMTSLKLITVDSVLVTWKVLDHSEIEFDGVVVYTVSDEEIRTSTVLGHASSSHVRGLEANKQYLFFLVPFWTVLHGTPSNSMNISTPEQVPKIYPKGLSIESYQPGIALLSWNPIPPEDACGTLTGYKVSFTSNGSSILRETQMTWLEAKDLVPGKFYTVKVAGLTKAGLGPWSEPEFITISTRVSAVKSKTGEGKRVPSILYAPPHPGWLLYLLLPLIILMVIGVLFLFRKFRRKSPVCSAENHSGTTLYRDSSFYVAKNQQSNIYSDQKYWRPGECDKGSSISSAKLLRIEESSHLNEYSEPRFQIQGYENLEPYATTALLSYATPRHIRDNLPGTWCQGYNPDDRLQVNLAALLPPPPKGPPPMGIPPHFELEPCSGSLTNSSSSSGRRCQEYPLVYTKMDSSRCPYPRGTLEGHVPCDTKQEAFHSFCTLDGYTPPLPNLPCDYFEAMSEPGVGSESGKKIF